LKVERILASEGVGLPIYLGGQLQSENVQLEMLRNHVFVLLSDFEGLPIALMEAMACGLVPVCLRIDSGVPELVENELTGLLVNDRSGDFVEAIRRLRNDPDLWKRLSQAARIKFETEYSVESAAVRWKEIASELQSNSCPRRPITIPKRVQLPPVNPALAYADTRKPSLKGYLMMQFGRVSNRMQRLWNVQ
jgi:glycosyltransferase involved in cell wall biosynthesis